MLNKSFKLLILLVLLLGVGCETTSPEDYADAKINEILRNLQIAFNIHDLDAIMNLYHIDYKQYVDGYPIDKSDIRSRWEYRLAYYDELEINNIDIRISNDFWATVTCDMIFIDDGEEIMFSEPSEENGDISYIYKEVAGDWLICGKEFNQ